VSEGGRVRARRGVARLLRVGGAFALVGTAGLLLAVVAVAGPSAGAPNKPPKTTTTVTTVQTTTTVRTTTVQTTTTAPTTTVQVPPPPPPPRQLVADISVTTLAPAGTAFFADSTATYTSVVTNTGPDAATGVYLSVQPEGARILASSAAGGSCSSSTAVDCALGSLASGASAVVSVTLAPASGSADVVHIARAGAAEPDPQTTNNLTRVETPVLAGHAGAPELTTPGGAFQPPLFARHSGNAWEVSTTVHLDEPASLSVQVLDAKGRPVAMLPGSLVNYLPARRPHTLIPHQIDRAQWVPLQLRIGGATGRVYGILARAVGPDGSSSTTTIHFRT
jgi:uncharacterized repeat protein (TIGR01451 family)